MAKVATLAPFVTLVKDVAKPAKPPLLKAVINLSVIVKAVVKPVKPVRKAPTLDIKLPSFISANLLAKNATAPAAAITAVLKFLTLFHFQQSFEKVG